MIKLFVSEKCPHCTAMMERVQEIPANIEVINITDSMDNLIEYLTIRDENPLFGVMKKHHKVGIPMAVRDGEVVFLAENSDITKL